MKKLIFTAAILFSCIFVKTAEAQIHFSVGVNIGLQPAWGPVGYDHADYYYMPDMGVYYSVPAHQYIYFQNNVWVHRPYLPQRYRNHDLYHCYKVVINDRNPWERDHEYHNRYASYGGRGDQGVIRDSRDERYRNHWNGDGGRGNDGGDHRDRGRGSDGGDHGDRGRGHDGGDHGDRGRGHDGGDH
ncbi:MAG: hypothetical protein ACHQIM_09690 [Sphingobacteriales bacterium]